MRHLIAGIPDTTRRSAATVTGLAEDELRPPAPCTRGITMPKPRYTLREHILPAREHLAKRFPDAFMRKGEPTKKPLKVGIAVDVLRLVKDIPREILKRAIGDYCTGPKYAKAMVTGATRVDLDGNAAGVVTPDAEAYTRAREAKRRKDSQDYHARRQAALAAAEEVRA
ncbi:ProQ/FinO family protein [Mesorhizobium sp. M0189]|uniref:ProQ/FinO family protein n=1 Tax=Mesorhizobium sp. M0189 TaxID=2956909 RepID=UPI00333D4382